jgi:hypothetical protein
VGEEGEREGGEVQGGGMEVLSPGGCEKGEVKRKLRQKEMLFDTVTLDGGFHGSALWGNRIVTGP